MFPGSTDPSCAERCSLRRWRKSGITSAVESRHSDDGGYYKPGQQMPHQRRLARTILWRYSPNRWLRYLIGRDGTSTNRLPEIYVNFWKVPALVTFSDSWTSHWAYYNNRRGDILTSSTGQPAKWLQSHKSGLVFQKMNSSALRLHHINFPPGSLNPRLGKPREILIGKTQNDLSLSQRL